MIVWEGLGMDKRKDAQKPRRYGIEYIYTLVYIFNPVFCVTHTTIFIGKESYVD